MHDLLRQLHRTLRTWARTPTLTLVALATLALGIGANTAFFSVLRAVVLSPLPYEDPSALVRIWKERPVSPEIYETIAAGTVAKAGAPGVASYTDVAIHGNTSVVMTTADGPVNQQAGRVSARHFEMLGAAPALGRGFFPEEHTPAGDDVVVISHGFWQTQLAGTPQVLGMTLQLDGRAWTIVGVMPADHRPLGSGWTLWLPLVIDRETDQYTDWLAYTLLGRLAPGVSTQVAQEATEASLTPLREKYPDRRGLAEAVPVVLLHDAVVGNNRAMLWLLFGAVLAVLLIACTNVANLLLARIGGRRPELALRSALGASRPRLLRQLLAESLALAVVGGLLGLLVAAWTLAGLAGSLTEELPRAETIAIDAEVLAFNAIASVLAGLLFGLLPAVRASRDTGSDLRAANRSRSPDARQHQLGAVLVAAEVALAVVLVSGAGLLIKSFWNLHRVDPGFRTEQVTTVRVQPPGGRYDDTARSRFFARVEDQLMALPGVDTVGGINLLPMTSGNLYVGYRNPELPPDEPPLWVALRIVTPSYFSTLEVDLLAGRPFHRDDREGVEAVGLINESLARKLRADAPEIEVVGRELKSDNGDPWFRIVGIVPDMLHKQLDVAPEPTVYRPVAQETWDTQMVYTLRSQGPPPSYGDLRRAVAAVDPGVPVADVAPFTAVVGASLGNDRRLVTLFAAFAGLALLLGGLGVYGVTAHAVAQRRHEHGVRLALGASGRDVVRGALTKTLAPVLLGLAAGLVIALTGGSLLDGWLFEVETTDPWVHATVLLFLTGCALLAGYLPARRAARVDPMVILGSD